jgi:hypothetical protein
MHTLFLCTNILFENPKKSTNPTNHVYNTVTHRENHFISTYSTISDLHATVAHGTMASIDKMNVVWPAVTVIAYCKHSENHCTSFREYHQRYLYTVNFVILISVPAALPPGINPLNTSGWSLQSVWCNNENMFASSLSLHIFKCLLLELIHFGRHKVFSVLSDVVKWARHPNTVVSGRSLIAKTQVRSQANQCAICDGLSDIGTRFYPSTSVYPHSITAPVLHQSQTLHNKGGWFDKLWEVYF